MADIALLVAEEFEKRVKREANGGGGEAGGEMKNFEAVGKVWSSWVESASAAAAGVSVNVAVRFREMEPKTGLGMAAVDGLFSA
ncbi:hypothetical protein HU200_025714 [Digitaria exilis]|uniref:Uncharacterized protein n=1 Tax=Digitaria exilis TaxID=1010633 RepID=A0A835EW90_9POAL|nr:hypothetical protein HU200_025714 [Digitaria exilis]